MNIVHLEGVIIGLNKVKDTNKDTKQYYNYDIIIHKHEVQLTDLIGNLAPDLLMEEMVGFEDWDTRIYFSTHSKLLDEILNRYLTNTYS